jgi:hypothetical protein
MFVVDDTPISVFCIDENFFALVGSKDSAELKVVLSTAVVAGWILTFQLKIDNV